MKFQIAFVFGVILLAVSVNAGVFEDTHKLIDLAIEDESKHIDSKCFSQIKDELVKELEVAAATYVDRVENGMPVFKKGVGLNMENFIENTILPKALISVNDNCLHSVKEELKVFIKSKFYAAFKTIDPDF